MEAVIARGVKVTYLASGHGPKNVILLHGWGSNPWVYEYFMHAAPRDQYRILALDFFGDSDRPWGGYNVSGFVDEVRDVMDALGMRTATLGGHSLGGITAQLFALRYLDRLDKLILIGTGATTKGHGKLTAMFERLTARKDHRRTLEDLIGGGYGTLPSPDTFQRYIDHAMKGPIDGLIEAMSEGMKYDFTPLLPFITVPTLIVHGDRDTGRLSIHAEALKKGIPKSTLVRLDCGHYPHEELPGEFNSIALKFLFSARVN